MSYTLDVNYGMVSRYKVEINVKQALGMENINVKNSV